jgi:hypothetical protein
MKPVLVPGLAGYKHLRDGIVAILETARRGSVRTVNAITTAAYWETGRRVSEFEMRGKLRADYGAQVLERLTRDLTARFGRGFSRPTLTRARLFYLAYPPEMIRSTLSNKSTLPIRSTASHQPMLIPQGGQYAVRPCPTRIRQTLSAVFTLAELTAAFPLSWSHYVLLLKARSPEARAFYEEEVLRGAWPVRMATVLLKLLKEVEAAE